jgi:hypothetical protein
MEMGHNCIVPVAPEVSLMSVFGSDGHCRVRVRRRESLVREEDEKSLK